MLKRNLEHPIIELALARHKMAFVSGPRQCGKTTMAKAILSDEGVYYNWDNLKFRKIWNSSTELMAKAALAKKNPQLGLDEIHKHKFWKRTLKGFFDEFGDKIQILVTGSARLNIYRRGGDSLMGRYLLFRLHPLSFAEALQIPPSDIHQFSNYIEKGFPELNLDPHKAKSVQKDLMKFGGFPEPYLNKNEALHRIWQRGRVEKIIREDLRDLSRLPELSQLEVLAALLPSKVGSPLSIKSLKEDLEVAHTTVTRWLNYFEQLYYFFQIRPYSKRVIRSLKKEPKIYLFDWSEIEDDGAKFENIVASHLLKGCNYWTDIGAANLDLYYLRNKEKQEVDFLIIKNKKPWFTVEAKLFDAHLDPNFKSFQKTLQIPHFQIVSIPGINKKFSHEGVSASVISFSDFFGHWP